jgi:hypothetical protein
VPVRVDQRVNVDYALVFDNHHVGVQIEGLELVKDDDRALVFLPNELLVEENDVGSLESLLAHVHNGAVALLEVDFEIQGVECPHRNFFLQCVGILILENGLIFRLDQILSEEYVVLLLEEGNEAGVLNQVGIRLNVQVLHGEPELVDVLACKE